MGFNLEKGSKNKKKKVEQPAVIMYVVIYYHLNKSYIIKILMFT